MNATLAGPAPEMAAPEPVREKERLQILDALRGLALCGILLVNIQGMGYLLETDRPLIFDAADRFFHWLNILLVEGTQRGLFSVLFGAGIILFLAKAERGETSAGRARILMRRRLFWLFVFGVINGTLLLWPGDILIIYAMAGPLVLPFWRASPRVLAGTAAAVILFLSAWSMAQQAPRVEMLTRGPELTAQAAAGARLDEGQQKMLKRWQWVQDGRPDDPDDVAEARAARMGGYAANLRYMSKTSWQFFWDLATLRWVLDAAAFMLVGMFLFRIGWLQGGAGPRTWLILMLAGYGLGLALRIPIHLTDWRNLYGGEGFTISDLLFRAAAFQPSRLFITLGHLGLFQLIWRAAPFLFRPFQPLGRMAFTGYLLQSVLAAIIFSGFGLGLWGRFGLAELWLVAAIIWIIEIAFAGFWLRRFEMGPLEWIWRTLTYGHAPAMRHARAAA